MLKSHTLDVPVTPTFNASTADRGGPRLPICSQEFTHKLEGCVLALVTTAKPHHLGTLGQSSPGIANKSGETLEDYIDKLVDAGDSSASADGDHYRRGEALEYYLAMSVDAGNGSASAENPTILYLQPRWPVGLNGLCPCVIILGSTFHFSKYLTFSSNENNNFPVAKKPSTYFFKFLFADPGVLLAFEMDT
ncbi:hypothetical protein NDU88_003107 [Pleurodeles waltl]|uniref:Uncharacterized protein n=1 Tax=Pleurodeles waltl TaxID=8319 RepID=A0AAV7T4A2_PLEWA|nr:hypothetical protein NDU88_003107 [Pleurodeles waltl]